MNIQIKGWTYNSQQPHTKKDIITPDITISDHTGQKKVLSYFNFSGNSDDFIVAVTNFFNLHASWSDAGLDDRLFLASGFFNKFIA